MASKTLRELSGLDNSVPSLAGSTVIMVDCQNTYTKGVMELEGWKEALAEGRKLLTEARKAGAEIIHIQHDGGEGSPYDIRAEIGEIHPDVAPVPGESVVVKTDAPNAFHHTDLAQRIEEAGNKDVVIAGFMTNMCVQFTAEGAFLRGYRPTVVAAASATRPISTAVGEVTAEQLHRSALATITDMYGVVVPSVDALT
ncbi:cysteine hydrolase family protein [Streptomyces sp. NPDC051963]|uniref:cysteine hydrolase family protein n=1 Tax=Streptomyces sp. NPDC051963 TaxID=3365678 RepID=UPI0037D5D215